MLVQAIQLEVEHHLVLLVQILLRSLDLVAVVVVEILMTEQEVDQQLDLVEDLGVVVEHQDQELPDNHHNPQIMVQRIMVTMVAVVLQVLLGLVVEVVVPVLLEVLILLMIRQVMVAQVNHYLHIPHLYYNPVFQHPSGLYLVQM